MLIVVIGVLKAGKNRSIGKSETAEYDSESLTESSEEEEDPQELIVQQVSLHLIHYVPACNSAQQDTSSTPQRERPQSLFYYLVFFLALVVPGNQFLLLNLMPFHLASKFSRLALVTSFHENKVYSLFWK